MISAEERHIQRARSAYIDGRIDIDELETRIERALHGRFTEREHLADAFEAEWRGPNDARLTILPAGLHLTPRPAPRPGGYTQTW